jgi:hypothetical protein
MAMYFSIFLGKTPIQKKKSGGKALPSLRGDAGSETGITQQYSE